MPIMIVKRYARSDLQDNRDRLYVFGDNLVGVGTGGQAYSCRGEPNAVGIPTKRAPSTADTAYFTDDDLGRATPVIDAAFERLAAHIKKGLVVIWPADGVGTGLAMLERKAPAIRAYIDQKTDELFALAHEIG